MKCDWCGREIKAGGVFGKGIIFSKTYCSKKHRYEAEGWK